MNDFGKAFDEAFNDAFKKREEVDKTAREKAKKIICKAISEFGKLGIDSVLLELEDEKIIVNHYIEEESDEVDYIFNLIKEIMSNDNTIKKRVDVEVDTYKIHMKVKKN